MKETRQSNENIELNERKVSGYAVVFDSPSTDIGWIETIATGAITEETIRNSDVLAKFNHDDGKVLARCKNGVGSLKLELDEHGLKYSFDAPRTALGDELLEYLNRGDITSSSFCFIIGQESGADEWTKEDGVIYRKINRIERLYDISPVWNPAYEETTCAKRFKEVENQSKEIDVKMDILKAEIDFI